MKILLLLATMTLLSVPAGVQTDPPPADGLPVV